jgi:hypothetical protein
MGGYTIGECPFCWSYYIEPPAEDVSGNPFKCSACVRIVAPLSPLIRHSFPKGSHIDQHGKVRGPEGELLYERKRINPEKPDGTVARIRKWLLAYDEGMCSEGEIGARLFQDSVDQIIAASESDWGVAAFSSYCGGEPPPPVIKLVEIEVGVAHVICRKPKQ